MSEDSQVDAPVRYRAFISYSHADARFAAWLHRKLEQWSPPGGPRLTPIFIDRAELAAGPDLSASVREALAGSAALIVLASPAARASQWVAQEVSLFRGLHPQRPVLAALLDGEPGDAFPEPLLVHGGQAFEPLAADFREGHDGKRLALLKIIAGLTAQPLDRLVQRDAQSRQRRVMWITAGAVLLSLILAAMLVVALRARAEADRQRADAEGMVEFMLTDLRDKLKGVGRLDVMDAVNERAMAHYANSADSAGLPDSVVLNRAKLLQAMAADDFDRFAQPGQEKALLQRGLREAEAAWRLTSSMTAREPGNLEAKFAHSQSEFYLGYGPYLDRPSARQRNSAAARQHFQEYRRIVSELVSREPANSRWQKELAYADGTLCSLLLEDGAEAGAARASCHNARVTMEAQYRANPADMTTTLDFANRLAWEADAELAAKQADRALALLLQQVGLVSDCQASFPSDTRPLEARMLAELKLAQTYAKIGRRVEARAAIAQANVASLRLRQLDPNNRNWAFWSKKIATTGQELN